MSSLINLLKTQTNGAADGTGILPLEYKAKALLGGTVPSYLVDYVLGLQLGIFGSYPDSKDVAPCVVFTVVFFLFFLAHLYIFARDYSRGHKFWLSLGFAFYCLMRWIGFIMRAIWAKNIIAIKLGIASEIFIIVPTILLASFNLVLAQRIFTWRHPVFGSSKFFWSQMILIYCVVIAILIMTIVASVIPYLYFLSEAHYTMCKKVQKVSVIFVCLYSVLALLLTFIAFAFKQRQDLNTTVYQPWWIQSFKPTYFPPKNAPQRAEDEILMKNPSMAQNSKRIIASSHHHMNSLLNNSVSADSPNNLHHSFSISLIALTSIFILIGAILRAVCTYMDRTYATQTSLFKPVVMYVIWGFLETIVNLIYLIGRVDLRFYRPDRISKSKINNVSQNGVGANNTTTSMQPIDSTEKNTNNVSHVDEKDPQSTEPSLDNRESV